jgi:uncharacterized protein (DUF433 family)
VGEVRILDRRLMTAREAARQLRIPSTTLIHWLEGENRNGKWYPPVLREEPTGIQEITWGEMVEARYLRAYRQKNVSMQRLRPFIGLLRAEFGVPYPLAHFKPFIDTRRRFLLEAQQELRLPAGLRMVYEVEGEQLVFDPRVMDFLERVDFDEAGDQSAQRIHPDGPNSPVVIDPALSSGASTVHGIRTEILAELADAQTPVEEIAEEFNLPVAAVKAALAHEWAAA